MLHLLCWCAFPNICTRFSRRPLAYGVRISSKARTTAAPDIFLHNKSLEATYDSSLKRVGREQRQIQSNSKDTVRRYKRCALIDCPSAALKQLRYWYLSSKLTRPSSASFIGVLLFVLLMRFLVTCRWSLCDKWLIFGLYVAKWLACARKVNAMLWPVLGRFGIGVLLREDGRMKGGGRGECRSRILSRYCRYVCRPKDYQFRAFWV